MMLMIGVATAQAQMPTDRWWLNLPEKPAHKFFDRENLTLLTTSATSLAADGYTTQKLQDFRFPVWILMPDGHQHGTTWTEANPLARPFIRTRAGTSLYFLASFGTETAGMGLLHKTRHHRLERLLPLLVTGTEAFYVLRNARQINYLQYNYHRYGGGL